LYGGTTQTVMLAHSPPSPPYLYDDAPISLERSPISIFRRLKERSGVKKVHAHLLRHTFAQHALLKGAERQAV
jgi:integrase